MTFLILPNREIADEIYATPIIELPPNTIPVLLGTPVELQDGRLCYCHDFDEATTDWLESYIIGISGAEILSELPYLIKNSES